jgi:hypothetical protein
MALWITAVVILSKNLESVPAKAAVAVSPGE